ncbi:MULTISPECIES: hypothetical protein [unclassified Variovorax]|uniref:hypothetical protein n=1 Tax=unclassified Variovorax TaxID=663243 RepID=UPI00076D2C06|nr:MULTISPECIES: hypothetical protein [unclassified Variovorax]KWT83876.1 hypothetical protein APY03_4431 [Variovorax sp. WDL1]PNG46558.1 hypothetical protein CHC06_06901 [Variovorax sp. B2]PNG47620.1 hypothetical protein CHC07_06786 [Variovorax sp. B4]VTV14324.1 hypothetical protein WDL1CHR_04874 [Variovorax sp. WDL1]
MSDAEAKAKKAFDGLAARAAINGYTCYATTVGNIVLSRLGGAWLFDGVAAASAWLDHLYQPSTEVAA